MSLLFWRKTQDTGEYRPDGIAQTKDVAATITDPIPVQLIQAEDNDIPPVRIDSGKVDPVVSRPASYNLTLTSADTEYSQALPANCRRFEFQCRTEFASRFAFEPAKVATSTAPYHTLKASDYYESGPINQASAPSTLYFASATAGVVMEILAWV